MRLIWWLTFARIYFSQKIPSIQNQTYHSYPDLAESTRSLILKNSNGPNFLHNITLSTKKYSNEYHKICNLIGITHKITGICHNHNKTNNLWTIVIDLLFLGAYNLLPFGKKRDPLEAKNILLISFCYEVRFAFKLHYCIEMLCGLISYLLSPEKPEI